MKGTGNALGSRGLIFWRESTKPQLPPACSLRLRWTTPLRAGLQIHPKQTYIYYFTARVKRDPSLSGRGGSLGTPDPGRIRVLPRASTQGIGCWVSERHE